MTKNKKTKNSVKKTRSSVSIIVFKPDVYNFVSDELESLYL